MDVERTMEFILQMQAKSEERMARAEARMDKFDRRMEAMGKLVQTGVKWLVKLEKTQQALSQDVKALTEAQRRTDRKFERFIDSWNKHFNGHRPRG